MSQNLSRIKRRVEQGGHNIPTESVVRRHSRVFANFWDLYRPLCSDWHIFDNSAEMPKRLLSRNAFEILNKRSQDAFVQRFLKGEISGK